MEKKKLIAISERLDNLLYLMETTLPSWVCAGEVMEEFYGISDSIKELAYDEEGVD